MNGQKAKIWVFGAENKNLQFKIRKLSHLSLHPDFRWDSQYLSCEPYKNKNLKYVPIGNTLTSSQYGVSIEMNEDNIGTKIYRMNEISNMLCDRNVLKYAELNDNQISSFKLKDRDVLFNRTNSKEFVGRTGIFRRFSDEDIVFASYLVRINPDPKIVTPEYLTAFLNTKYGIIDIKRRARHSVNQSNVNLEEAKRIEIPLLCNQLQGEITSSFDKAFDLIQASDGVYNEAQTLLLAELGLADWQPKHQLTFVKNFSDTKRAERIDAAYFQPKYDEIVNAIKNYSGGWDTLGNLTTLKKCVEVGSKEYLEIGIPFVRVSNLSPFEITEEKYISEELYAKIQEHQPQKGEILLSKDGTPGIACYLREEPKEMIPSSGILRLKSKTDKIGNQYLTLVLNSILTEEQVNRDVGGSVILHWRPNQVAEMIIPILHQDKQTEIEQKVFESFNLRNHAKNLLERAKRAVEIAIEQDEQTAINWLESVSRLT